MFASSFCGVIDEIPYIRVDNFENSSRQKQKIRAYFLSHCHTDHTQGLFSDELFQTLEKTKAKIYMSEQTSMVIQHEDELKSFRSRLEEYIVPLKLGPNLVTLPANPEENLEEIFLDVTLIAAGHCIGSTMFLFRTMKTILYTGDFRVNSNDLKSYTYLHDNKRDPIKINVMYVDTTFIDERYSNFPKRSASVESMIWKIECWLREDSNNAVAIHTSAKYGYEYVFNKIYEKLRLKVCVSQECWSFYSKQNSVTGVTCKPSKIHLCRNRHATNTHNWCPGQNEKYNYLYVHLSAMKWGDYDDDEDATEQYSNILSVCFSTHCSRRELRYFVEYFNPDKVVGFPRSYDMTPRKKDNIQVMTPRKRKMDSPLKSDDKVSLDVIREIMFDV